MCNTKFICKLCACVIRGYTHRATTTSKRKTSKEKRKKMYDEYAPNGSDYGYNWRVPKDDEDDEKITITTVTWVGDSPEFGCVNRQVKLKWRAVKGDDGRYVVHLTKAYITFPYQTFEEEIDIGGHVTRKHRELVRKACAEMGITRPRLNY